MSKQEYMHDLWESLGEFGDDVRNEIVEDYEEHFADGLEMGKSEEQIVNELGNIDELVNELRALKGDNNSKAGDSKADFEKKKESFNDFTKGFASAIGSLAATISSEAEKFIKAASENTDGIGNIINEVGEKVVNKSTEFANEFKESFYEKKEGTNTEDKSDAYSSKEVKNLILEACCGNIEIKDSSDGAFHVFYKNFGSPNQQLLYHFDFSQQDDTAYVSVKKESGITNFFKTLTCPRIELTIEIPSEFKDIKARTLAGNVKCKNFTSENIDVNTMAGNVDFVNINANDILANTMAGNVRFDENSAASLTTKTNAGNLDVKGNIQIVKAVSNAGNVKLRLTDTKEINASTTAGNIKIVLPDSSGYNVDTQSPCGNIKLVYKDSVIKGNRIGNYNMGDGSVIIKARTSAGNINISDND